MTGFAPQRKQTPLGELTVSFGASITGRWIFIFIRAAILLPFENATRALSEAIHCRGHLEVRISLAVRPGAGVHYDRESAGRYVAAFREAAEEFRIGANPI